MFTASGAAYAATQPTLASAVILGSKAYSPAELFPVYRAQLGQPITRASAQAIVTALEQMYLSDGLARPELQIDDDLVTRGILRVGVFELRIAEVTISGDAGPYRERLESLADELRTAEVLRRTQIPELLQRMRALPGLTVSATTKRDEAVRNSYRLAVEASFRPVEAQLRFTNRGLDEVGPYFMSGQVVANGLFGRQERLGLLFAAAGDFAEFHGAGLFADLPVAADGTRVLVTAFRSDSDPSEAPVDLSDRHRRQRGSLRLTHPLRSGESNWYLSSAFEFDDQVIERSGSELREDRLRILELGTRFDWRAGSSTQYLATMELRRGLNAFGAGLQAADLTEDPRRSDFLLARLQLVRFTRLNDSWSLRFDALGQYSEQVLPYTERFKIGGDRLGRGFEVTEIAGDRGLGGKLELRRELTNAASAIGRTSVYGSYDIGAAWARDVGDRASAATAAIGVASQGQRVNGYLELAKPLTHPDVEGNRSATLFAELSFRF